ELEVPRRDPILRKERVLVDIGGGVKIEQAPAAGQIKGEQARREGRAGDVGIIGRVRLKARGGALAWSGEIGIASDAPVGIDARVVKSRVRDTEPEILEQPRLLQID